MALFGLFNTSNGPFKEDATNLMYELLFCDKLDLYKKNIRQADAYPWNILFSKAPGVADLQQITNDLATETRVKILAYNSLAGMGQKAAKKELLAVIVEVGLEQGLDVLASFSDGTARYINQTGKMIIWETSNAESIALTNTLFNESAKVVQQIGPWDKARLPHPAQGNLRITFLVSDGLYFGEGPMNVLFSDPLANPALMAATRLMQYLTEKAI